jgi:hypothetical protein
MWWIVLAVLVLVFLVWADRRTRGRGNKDSKGGGDHPTGRYI